MKADLSRWVLLGLSILLSGNYINAEDPKAVTVYVQELKDKGYAVKVEEGPAKMTLLLEKDLETAEGHGLLGVKWTAKQRFELEYRKSPEGLKLESSSGVVEKKAPVLGQWREDSKKHSIPADIYVEKLSTKENK